MKERVKITDTGFTVYKDKYGNSAGRSRHDLLKEEITLSVLQDKFIIRRTGMLSRATKTIQPSKIANEDYSVRLPKNIDAGKYPFAEESDSDTLVCYFEDRIDL